MPGTVRLIFGVHSHQPIGNFDDVFAKALDHAYDPFLDALERHPTVQVVMHYSGCLCEWLDRHAPAHLDRMARLAQSGQVEILTGGFYEPILPLIPMTDRLGQIRMQTRYIRQRFGVEARGMWLPERVWEPTLPPTLSEAGVEYTLLDDYHFLTSMDEDPVGGYYLTEDQGRITRLFPISEKLRYLIPFREPRETIEYLGTLASGAKADEPEPVAVIVDDGEKFGLWPGTREWVHGASSGGSGWLEAFLTALEQNASWLRTTTFRRTVSEIAPRKRVYLPPGSYFEMGEWALPRGRGTQLEAAIREARRDGAWDQQRPFLRGGFFRNFLAKYPESFLMARRAQLLSEKLDERPKAAASDRDGRPSPARQELWRGMCNCSYWHGIFGGLYLPHLRRVVGRQICRAGRLAEKGARGKPGARARLVDIDADDNAEIDIQTSRLSLVVEPARGGAISVLDIKPRDFPLGLTLARRIEIYHEEVLRPRNARGTASDHASIHELTAAATEEMKALVVADDRTRASAVDRFVTKGTRAADLAAARGAESGDFFNGRYTAALIPARSRAPRTAGVVMAREGRAGGRSLSLTKTLRVSNDGPALELAYVLKSAGAGRGPVAPGGLLFAVEFNLALIEDRSRFVILEGAEEGKVLSPSECVETPPMSRLRVAEDSSGFDLDFRVEPEASFWHYPVRTLSRSEKGYEAIYQGSALLLVWGEAGDALPGETRVELDLAVRDPAPRSDTPGMTGKTQAPPVR